MNELKVTYEQSQDVAVALCPICNGAFTHHSDVIIYDRSEDDEHTTRIETNSGGVDLVEEKSNSNNPSSRRHGIRIAMFCEVCGDLPDLAIRQHKGCTEIAWCDEKITKSYDDDNHSAKLKLV